MTEQEPVAWTDALKDAFFEGFTAVQTYNDTWLNSPEEAWRDYKPPNIAPQPQPEPAAWLVKWANAYDGEAYTEWQKGYDAARSVVKAYLTGNHTHSQEPERPEPAQQADPTDPGHDVDVLREHVRHLERRVRELHAQQAEPAQDPFALPCPTPKACMEHCCSGHCIPRTAPQPKHPGTMVGRIATDEEMRHRDPRWGRVIWMPEASIVDKFHACDLYAVRRGAQP